MRLSRVVPPLIGVSACLLLAACGGDDDDSNVAPQATTTVVQDTAPAPTPELQPQPNAPQELDPEPRQAEAGVIAIEAAAQAFAPNRWVVSIGENLTITVTNNDEVAHNLRIAGVDGAFGTEDDAITAPDSIAAGAAGEVTFAPLVPGDYTFRCDFHPDLMGGRIEVQAGLP